MNTMWYEFGRAYQDELLRSSGKPQFTERGLARIPLLRDHLLNKLGGVLIALGETIINRSSCAELPQCAELSQGHA